MKNKEDFFKYMKKNKIICQFHYIPLFKFSILKNKKFYNTFHGANEYSKNCLSLPIFYKLNETNIGYIVKKINSFIDNYKKIS